MLTGCLTYSAHREKPPNELLASGTCIQPSESITARRPGFYLSIYGLTPVPSSQNSTIRIPNFYKRDLIENLERKFHYKWQLPLCLGGMQFRLLLESASWAASPFCSNKCSSILYYDLKLILVYKPVGSRETSFPP